MTTVSLLPITADNPLPGEQVVLYNGVRAWVTDWKPALATSGTYPATHFARVALPYAPIAEDKTKIRERDAYEVVRLAKKRER